MFNIRFALGPSTRLGGFAIWMIPTRSPFCCYHFPACYSLVVLCLDAYVKLTFMSCKTELSLINHLVILSCHLVPLKMLRDQSRYLQESVASTSQQNVIEGDVIPEREAYLF